uniref:Pyrin and HIN domain family member 1 n=1 Tax=Aotus nancymaae TaxID=37293 RepID=A0A2K5D655_AOTNA
MGKKYKNIVLLKGLEGINDYHFRMVKSLLSSDLKLNPKMREEYDKIQIADLLEEKFPGDAGLGKLIQILKQIPTLGDFAETLKKEKKQETDPAVPAPSAVRAEATPEIRKISTKKKTETKKSKMSEEQTQPPCPAGASMFTAVGHSPPPQPSSSAPPDAFSIEVRSSWSPFKKMMFHATVVTPTQFFHVKVLNINLKEKFSGKKIITISDYLEYDNLLEVNEGSSVSEAGPDQKLEVPNKIISRAKETLKIDILHKQASGNIVYGIFTLLKVKVNQKQKSTTYEIEDDRGKMDVVGTGQCHDIPCEDGDKLHLFCFRLRKKNQMSKLISEMHSFIEVKKKTNPRNYAPKSMKLPQEQSQLLNTSEASTTLPESHPQTPQMPPITASGSSVIKESEDPFPKINEFWRMHKETWQFPGPSMTSRGPVGSHPQTPQMSASTPSSSFFTTVPLSLPNTSPSFIYQICILRSYLKLKFPFYPLYSIAGIIRSSQVVCISFSFKVVKKENKKDALNPDSYMKTSNSFF